MKSAVSSYVNLTKPTIVLLFALTGLAAMVVQGDLLHAPVKMLLIMVGIILTAGSANSLNMYFDRDIDEIMKRTKKRRPLPKQEITPQNALIFGLVLGVVATALLWITGNLLAAALGVGTIFFYVGIYTLILKRRTPYNIVIGGAAGATAPLIGWAAATGHLSLIAWLMFLIIFVWTPPHFWALALVVKEDYREANVPMLPVVAGDQRTRVEILVYTIVLIPLTLAPVLIRAGGLTYLIGGVALGGLFLRQAIKMFRLKTDKSAYRLFGYSIVYLLVLFILLIAGSLLQGPKAYAAAPISSPTGFTSKFNQLQLGMTADQVVQLIGSPQLRESKLNDQKLPTENWHYQDSLHVSFEDGKVTAFGKETPQTAAVSPTPADGSLAIGDTCSNDKQCAGHNCHFHLCSGKNNCSVPEGKICATDADCCTHFCDFSVCKKKI